MGIPMGPILVVVLPTGASRCMAEIYGRRGRAVLYSARHPWGHYMKVIDGPVESSPSVGVLYEGHRWSSRVLDGT